MGGIAVWGAGAIGGVIGAWMARAGADVVLVDRYAPHVAAINASGLLIDGIREPFRQPVRASTPDRLEGSFDLIFLAVKCMDTAEAVESLAPHLAADGAVVSAQNGLNEVQIAARLGPERTVGCFVNFGADWLGPGHVQHGGEHPIWVGELDGRSSERIERVRDLLGAFCETTVTDNIWGYLWSKLTFASVLFATALVDAPVHEIVRRPEAADVLFRLGRESMAVPRAKGIRLERLVDFRPEDYEVEDGNAAMERMAEHFEGQVKVKTGVWRDLAVRHRRTEVDCQVGELVRQAEAIGVHTPMNRRLIALIHDLEDGRRSMGWDTLALLAAVD